MNNENNKVVTGDIKQATKIGCAIENMTMGELAKKTGREGSTLSGILSRGTPSLKVAIDVLKGVKGTIIVRFDNGQEVELTV